MSQIRIQSYIAYCMGFGYLNKSRYANDLAHERTLDQMFQARLDQFLKLFMQRMTQQIVVLSRFKLPEAEPQTLQRAFQAFFKPILNFFTMLPNIPNALITAAAGVNIRNTALLTSLTSKILSFFFGYKKDKTEEKEKREKDDFAKTDLFTKRTVEPATNSGSGEKR